VRQYEAALAVEAAAETADATAPRRARLHSAS